MTNYDRFVCARELIISGKPFSKARYSQRLNFWRLQTTNNNLDCLYRIANHLEIIGKLSIISTTIKKK